MPLRNHRGSGKLEWSANAHIYTTRNTKHPYTRYRIQTTHETLITYRTNRPSIHYEISNDLHNIHNAHAIYFYTVTCMINYVQINGSCTRSSRTRYRAGHKVPAEYLPIASGAKKMHLRNRLCINTFLKPRLCYCECHPARLGIHILFLSPQFYQDGVDHGV